MQTTKMRRATFVALTAMLAMHGSSAALLASSLTKADMAGLESEAIASTDAKAPTVAEGSQLLPNGNFELGSAVWTEFSQNGFDIILHKDDPDNPPPVLPYSGSWLAWLGGDFDEISYIQQQIVLPANAGKLSYQHWIDSEDLCGSSSGLIYDIAKISVNGAVVDEFDLCDDTNTGGWVLYQVDIASYAGQTVTIRIRVDTDATWNSNLFVDDVAIELRDVIFADGFESGNVSNWSASTP